jgi:hypothetical protein
MPAPFASREVQFSNVCFFQDLNGTSILLSHVGDSHLPEVWLLLYPVKGKPPRRILQKLPDLHRWRMSTGYRIIDTLWLRRQRTRILLITCGWPTSNRTKTPFTTGTDFVQAPLRSEPSSLPFQPASAGGPELVAPFPDCFIRHRGLLASPSSPRCSDSLRQSESTAIRIVPPLRLGNGADGICSPCQ